MNALFADEPMLRLMWEEYELCRSHQWVSFERQGRNGKGEVVHFAYPTHIAVWPNSGGLGNQPYLYVRVFRAFLYGERQGTLRRMQM